MDDPLNDLLLDLDPVIFTPKQLKAVERGMEIKLTAEQARKAAAVSPTNSVRPWLRQWSASSWAAWNSRFR
jgi:hypothetical protein